MANRRVRTAALTAAQVLGVRERFAKLYEEFGKLPVIKAAYFAGDFVAIETSRRDLEQDVNRRMLHTMSSHNG